jgi:PPE-repeat protein
MAWLTKIGFIKYWNNVLEPLSNALYNNPFFAAMFSGFDPYLPILGNPLTFLSPYNVAFALGYPMDIGSYVAYLSQTFFYIGLDLTAAFAGGAGPQGFAGTATKTGAGQAAGLTTLADDAFGGGPRMPMIPGTWGADSPPPPEPGAGD